MNDEEWSYFDDDDNNNNNNVVVFVFGVVVVVELIMECITKAAKLKKSSKYKSYFIKDLDVHDRWAVVIFYTWNYEMFLQSFNSLVFNGFDQRIIVLDNSNECEAANDPYVINHSQEIIPLYTQHTFTQVLDKTFSC